MKTLIVSFGLVLGLSLFLTGCFDSSKQSSSSVAPLSNESLICQSSLVASERGGPQLDAISYKVMEMSKDILPIEERYNSRGRDHITPTEKVSVSKWPSLIDDLDFDAMEVAIERQLQRYSEISLSGTVKFGNDVYPQTQVKASLQRFLVLTDWYKQCLNNRSRGFCQDGFESAMRDEFNMYKPKLTKDDPRYGEDKQTLFTAYYRPLINGRSQISGEFRHGIYNKPKSKSLASQTRRQIDFRGVLNNKGVDVAYSENMYKLYLMHVQGSGRVIHKNNDGSIESYYLTYDGTNGQRWDWISKHMVRKGYIDDYSIESQIEFLDNNPDKHEEIYSSCPSYVYFKKANHPPLGSGSAPVTDNRTIATDWRYYRFKGVLSFLKTQKPAPDTKSACRNTDEIPYHQFSRFFLDQDTGGAIRGKARVDMYFGEGPYAEKVAFNTVERGDLYFLMLKK